MPSAPASPTPPAADTATCTYCHVPIPTADIPSITALVQEYSLPVGLCLRCTLDVLEDLKLPLDDPAPRVARRRKRTALPCHSRGRYALLPALSLDVRRKEGL